MSVEAEPSAAERWWDEAARPAAIAETRARAAAALRDENGAMRPLVVFGAGQLGRQILAAARRADWRVLALCDNDAALHGTRIDGVAIASPEAAVAAYDADATFVTGVFNASSPARQLRATGCSRIASYPQLFWQSPDCFEGITGLALPHVPANAATAARAAHAAFSDRQSREEFAAQMAWKLSLDSSRLPPPSPKESTYFDDAVFTIGAHEVVVDCGAYDGDSLRAYASRFGTFDGYVALEPDPKSRAAFADNLDRLDVGLRARVTILPYAASEAAARLNFAAGRGVASKVDAAGTIEIESRRLDDAIDANPTIVKMDIEGAEAAALRGMERIVARCRPTLAVSAYHFCDDIWTLTLLLAERYPDYRLFLRRYAEDCWETVIYAVAPERVAAGAL